MKQKEESQTRRRFIRNMGIGAAAFYTGKTALAGLCEQFGVTTSQVTGPFPPRDFAETVGGRRNPGEKLPVLENDADLTRVGEAGSRLAEGQAVFVRGRVLNQNCDPVPQARVELWQADHAGHYNHQSERAQVRPEDLDPHFGYWGSIMTGNRGEFLFKTIVPGHYPAGGDWVRPPHLHWMIKKTGFSPLTTQTYFDGDVLLDRQRIRRLNEADLILNLRGPFTQGLSGARLQAARAKALAQLVIRFREETEGDLAEQTVGDVEFTIAGV